VWTHAADLHLEHLDDSIVVYDLADAQIHCLSGATRAVFEATGATGSAEIALALGVDREGVEAQLAGLEAAGLVVASGQGPSRKAVVTGTAMGVALALFSIAAPTAAAAASKPAAPAAPAPTPVTPSVANPPTGRS
jgi:hypothetical protein